MNVKINKDNKGLLNPGDAGQKTNGSSNSTTTRSKSKQQLTKTGKVKLPVRIQAPIPKDRVGIVARKINSIKNVEKRLNRSVQPLRGFSVKFKSIEEVYIK